MRIVIIRNLDRQQKHERTCSRRHDHSVRSRKIFKFRDDWTAASQRRKIRRRTSVQSEKTQNSQTACAIDSDIPSHFSRLEANSNTEVTNRRVRFFKKHEVTAQSVTCRKEKFASQRGENVKSKGSTFCLRISRNALMSYQS